MYNFISQSMRICLKTVGILAEIAFNQKIYDFGYYGWHYQSKNLLIEILYVLAFVIF